MAAAVASAPTVVRSPAELFRTRLRDGLLGDFSFDARGDSKESPVTILRVGGDRSS